MSDDATALLIQQLYDGREVVRGIAAHRLLNYPEIILSEIVQFLEFTLPGENRPLRCCSWHAINRIRSLGVPFLLGQAESSDAHRRERAIELLGSVGGWHGGTHFLQKQYLEDRPNSVPEWEEHAEAVQTMLERSLSDPELCVRFAAAFLLENLNRSLEEAIPVFIDALLHGNRAQRNYAALHLGRIGPLAHSACEALAQVAVIPNDNADYWVDKMILAAQVALRRIGCGSDGRSIPN